MKNKLGVKFTELRLKKKILGFRWSKKAKITLETKAFGEAFPSIFYRIEAKKHTAT